MRRSGRLAIVFLAALGAAAAPPSGLFLEGVYYEGDAGPPPIRAAVPVAPFPAVKAR